MRWTDQVIWREEAADPAALPACVGHEGVGNDAHAQPAPLRAPRVLVMAPSLHPAAGLGADLLHQVEHVLAVHPPVDGVVVLVAYQEVFVQPAGPFSLPPGAEVRLVLHFPRSLRSA